MKDIRSKIGRVVAELRAQANMTQPQLAEAIGVEQSAISKIENGRQGVTTENVVAMTQVFGCRLSEFWERVEKATGTAGDAVTKPAAAKSKKLTHVDQDIDAIRYALGAIAIVVGRQRSGASAEVLKELGKAPTEYLEKEGLLDALMDMIEHGDERPAKAGKQARARGAV